MFSIVQSNGVYWSGLYAAVDTILQTINTKSPVNIPQVVANLRKADSQLFQTEVSLPCNEKNPLCIP